MTIPFPAHAWPLMRSALRHIADHEDQFWMGAFIQGADDALTDFTSAGFLTVCPPRPACGTVACLAGRLVLIDRPHLISLAHTDPDIAFESLAFESLRIDGGDYRAVRRSLLDVFMSQNIANYGELRASLLARFTFPEPLPESITVVAQTEAVGGRA
jgi:hypothetical protein